MSLIPDDIIAQVIDRSDMVEVISSYIPLKRAGRNFKANCPFHHEKTPSFMVNPDKQIYHCFGCGVGGNVVSFVMKQEHMEFPEAIRFLALKVNIEIPTFERKDTASTNLRQEILKVNELAANYYHKILLSDKNDDAKYARDYLKKRGISLETVQKCSLGFAPDSWDSLLEHLKGQGLSLGLMEKAGLIIPRENREGYYDRFRNRIIFPIFDNRGSCRAFGGRALAKDDNAKYINSPETLVYIKGQHLYGFHVAKESIGQKDFAVVVEGYMDFVQPFQSGVNNIVASLGTALTVEQIRLIRRYTKNIVMLFDMDAAGEAAILRSLDTLVEESMNVKVAKLSEGEDPDSFIKKFGVEKFEENIQNALTLFDYKLNILVNRFDAKTIEGKAQISFEMLSTIGKFDNEIIKAGYISRLSKVLGVPEEALKAELKKSFKEIKAAPKQEGHENRSQGSVPLRNVERHILKLMLEDETLILSTKKEVRVDDFQDVKIRNVISKLYELFDQGKKIDGQNLITSFEDEETQTMITQLVVEEEFGLGDKTKMHRDFVSRMKNDRLKSLRHGLLQQIREAEVAGDQQKLEDLKIQFNRLIKK